MHGMVHHRWLLSSTCAYCTYNQQHASSALNMWSMRDRYFEGTGVARVERREVKWFTEYMMYDPNQVHPQWRLWLRKLRDTPPSDEELAQWVVGKWGEGGCGLSGRPRYTSVPFEALKYSVTRVAPDHT